MLAALPNTSRHAHVQVRLHAATLFEPYMAMFLNRINTSLLRPPSRAARTRPASSGSNTNTRQRIYEHPTSTPTARTCSWFDTVHELHEPVRSSRGLLLVDAPIAGLIAGVDENRYGYWGVESLRNSCGAALSAAGRGTNRSSAAPSRKEARPGYVGLIYSVRATWWREWSSQASRRSDWVRRRGGVTELGLY